MAEKPTVNSLSPKASDDETEAPLFPTKQKSDGTVQTIYGTNNTVELLKEIPKETVERRLDNVLDAVKTLDVTCDHEKCKTKTNLIGQNCDYCKKRYCFKHGLPEVHGCGEAVKRDEQKRFHKPVPRKVVQKQEDLTKAQKRLESKLKDMNLARKAKLGDGSSSSKKKTNTKR